VPSPELLFPSIFFIILHKFIHYVFILRYFEFMCSLSKSTKENSNLLREKVRKIKKSEFIYRETESYFWRHQNLDDEKGRKPDLKISRIIRPGLALSVRGCHCIWKRHNFRFGQSWPTYFSTSLCILFPQPGTMDAFVSTRHKAAN
jgi:hypothetical protein